MITNLRHSSCDHTPDQEQCWGQATNYVRPTKALLNSTALPRSTQVMGVVALNELLTLAFLIVNFDHWKVQAPENIRPLPDVYTTFGHIFVAMVAHDICFYHFHRLLVVKSKNAKM